MNLCVTSLMDIRRSLNRLVRHEAAFTLKAFENFNFRFNLLRPTFHQVFGQILGFSHSCLDESQIPP